MLYFFTKKTLYDKSYNVDVIDIATLLKMTSRVSIVAMQFLINERADKTRIPNLFGLIRRGIKHKTKPLINVEKIDFVSYKTYDFL